MNKARIAQMESSRIVGGRAQTQALLRAPDSEADRHDGDHAWSASHGARGGTRADSIPLPSGSIRSPVPTLKSLNLAQAVFDGLAVLFWFFFFAALFGSVPLAIGLLIFASF